MDEEQVLTIKENIERVNANIQQAAKRAGRDPGEITLVAVTKEKSAPIVKTLAENNVNKIGESYLQEASFKIDLLKDFDIEWHMIGNIQKGKEKHIPRLFQVVHSVGSKRTARELNKYAQPLEITLPVYLELNVSGESTKQGWDVQERKDLDQLLPVFEEILDYPALKVMGLMTMAPYSDNPEDARPYFKKMRSFRDALLAEIPGSAISELSMGMSGDYQVAIEEGATVLRIGSALVGPR